MLFRSLLSFGLLSVSLAASEITPHITNLNNPDYEVRQAARLALRQELVEATPRELKPLQKELFQAIGPENDWATRDWSIRMLELVGTKAAVKPLRALLDDPDPRIADLARRALTAIPGADGTLEKIAVNEGGPGFVDSLSYRDKQRSVKELIALLQDGSPDAALALGKIGGRKAQRALVQAHAKASDEFQVVLEYALLDAGLPDAEIAQSLVANGHTPGVKAAAFAQLIELDFRTAESVLETLLTSPFTPERAPIIRHAMGSFLSYNLVPLLDERAPADQAVILGAIADLNLRQFEEAVLNSLKGDLNDDLQAQAIRTLGHIGSDASYEPLLSRYLANSRDRDVTAALARLQAPSADARLMAVATGEGDTADRVAALRLLVLRNTDGITELVNTLAAPDQPQALRQAAYRGMAVVGDNDSLRLLFTAIRDNDPLKRQAQGALKKLSANLAVTAYLWEEFYGPAFASAVDDDHRRDLLAILDGNSGPDAAAYLAEQIANHTELRPAALQSLQRWTHISAIPVWQDLMTAEDAPAAEIALAQRNTLRLLTSPRITGNPKELILHAKWSIEQFSGTEHAEDILACFDGENPWLIRVHITLEFPPLIENPDHGEAIAELIERVDYRQ